MSAATKPQTPAIWLHSVQPKDIAAVNFWVMYSALIRYFFRFLLSMGSLPLFLGYRIFYEHDSCVGWPLMGDDLSVYLQGMSSCVPLSSALLILPNSGVHMFSLILLHANYDA
jgi:hypothetical protein